MNENLLIEGDNISGLIYLLETKNLRGQIDLVYIDPPFATGSNFTITNGRASTISNSKNGTLAYTDKLKGDQFISFLKQRLVLLKELLSNQGSIYLHIDYKIGHYVKVMMDEVFGTKSFRNDITRIKCNPKNFSQKGYGNIKDMILFYTKNDSFIWNEPHTEYTLEDQIRLYPKTDSDGRRYTTVPIHAPGETNHGRSNQLFKGMNPPAGRHWRTDVETLNKWDDMGLLEWSSNGNPRKKNYMDEMKGKKVQDIWEYKDPPYPVYPTEKNIDMLHMIVNASSNEDSIVLDCFCGSGSTLYAATLNGRNWIGIDKSKEAINITKKRFDEFQPTLFCPKPNYTFFELCIK
ncbi:MAG: site-specific DNA-methyltransferase [Flavobacteriaceae bacterium]|nr:site-specific DNA-methyltransferase [Flavobacteriaceae bacterium]MCY4216042.1 site-specific DNA-methyltransferase [Flavobacteriaceae bacterium]MCY4266849.1 site-specific DNA-methyltransferase [Flavobacteriaceae bacterium]MCY4299593.1 site-specific DNA-methyltransferase [Flavobacteriaceae bacterium]